MIGDQREANGAAGTSSARKTKLARSGIATVIGQFSTIAISTGATIIMARLLDPADFGLVAMVQALILFIGSFRDFGLPMAALQSRDLDHLQSSALFWTNLPITIGVTLFMILMGPVLSWFFGAPELTLLTAVMSIGVLAPALANQHEALLTRQLRFGALVAWDAGFLIVGVVSAIGLALLGAGYWALAAQFIVWQVGRAVSVWIVTGWMPASLRAAREARRQIRQLLSFGAYLTGYRVIAHAGRDIDRVLVGYVGGPQALGLYDAAFRWARLPIQQLYTPLLGVAVAALSTVREDAAAYRRHVRLILTPVFSLSIPVLIYAAIAADALILLLLGPKWSGAIPLFRALCIGTTALAASKTMKWLYVSLGETKRQFRWGLFYAPIFALCIAVGASYGAEGAAIAYAVAQWGLLLPGLAYCLHGSPLRLDQFLHILARPLAAALIAGGFAWAVGLEYGNAHHLLQLTIKAGLFFPLYAAVWLLMPGGRTALQDSLALITSLRRRQSAGSGSDIAPTAVASRADMI